MNAPFRGVGADTPDALDIGASSGSTLIRTWLPLIVVGALTMYAGVRAAGPITDPDSWWHIRLGDEFRGNWSIAHPGQLSPFAIEPWVATQWTLELVGSYFEDWFGLSGIALLTGIGVAVVVQSMWAAARLHAQPLPAVVAVCAGLAGAAPVLAPRPQIASLILLAVFVSAWFRTVVDLRPRWWLIPLTWLWAGTHGFWFVGVLVGIVFAVGIFADGAVNRRGAGRLLLIPVASLLMAALTPAGPRVLLAPFMVSGVKDFIQEWQSPSFQSSSVMAVGAMAAIVVVSWARRGNTTWTELLVFGFSVLLLVYAVRTVALAAVLLVPIAAATMQTWVPGTLTRPDGVERRLVWGAGLLAVGAVLLVTMGRTYVHPYPESIDKALGRLEGDSVVMNDYAFGGWMAWRHPDLVHGIDGMTEAYPPEYVAAYYDALQLEPGWESFVERIGATHSFLPSDHRLVPALLRHHGWVIVAETEQYVLLASP